MSARRLRWAALPGALAILLSGGAAAAPGQVPTQGKPAAASKTLPDLRAERNRLQDRHDAADRKLDVLRASISLGESCERDLREGRLVAVVNGERVVLMRRAAFNQSLLRHATLEIVAEATRRVDRRTLGLAADAALLKEMVRALERDALQESEAYRQRLEADLAANRTRAARLQEWRDGVWDEIRRLRDRIADLEAADLARGVSTPDPTLRQWPLTSEDRYFLSERKQILGLELDEIRKAGRWHADHHYQVGMLIGLARTFKELGVTEKLMRDYAACYDARNQAMAAVGVNDRAKRYPTPGDRMRETNRIADEFNGCMSRASAAFQEARGR